MTAVEYIQSLERKVEELEAVLDRDSSLNHEEVSTPPTPPSGQGDKPFPESSVPSASPTLGNRPAQEDGPAPENGPSSAAICSGNSSVSASDEDVIETMVGTGEHDSPHTDSFERYRGSFAGLSLLRRVHNLCMQRAHASTARKNSDAEALQDDFIHAFDFASPDSESSIPWDAFVMLPSRDSVDRAIDIVVNQACCNMQFLDRLTLEQIAVQVYAEAEGEPRRQSRKPLALLYAILALSRRFEPVSGDGTTAQSIRGYGMCPSPLKCLLIILDSAISVPVEQC